MSGISQGPPPAGPPNHTRFELEVYLEGQPPTKGVREAVEAQIDASGVKRGALQSTGYYNEVDNRSRVQVLGAVSGVLTVEEIRQFGVQALPAGTRIDAQAWPVHLAVS